MLLENHNAIEVGGYAISNSLRFQSASSQYLSRTPASAGNRKTWTWSGWVKLGNLSELPLINSYVSANDFLRTGITNNQVYVQYQITGVYNPTWISNAVFRDPSAWYHIVIVWDTTQASAVNYVKIYVNGVQQSLVYALNGGGTLPQNTDGQINSTIAQRIGLNAYSSYADGYMAEINHIDGQALTPSSFGTTDTTTGQWIAKKYTGTYGTNGFYLPFSNGTSTTTLGADSSGNGNNWTLNNFTRSAGVSDCWMFDVPSGNGGVSGTQPSSNYAVLNPLDKETACTVAGGNLNWSSSAGGTGQTRGTVGVSSGKWYWEVTNTVGLNLLIGISTQQSSLSFYPGNDAYGWSYFSNNGNKYNNAVSSTYGASYTTNDVIGIAFDADAGTLAFYKNGVSQGTAYSSITGSVYFPSVGDGSGGAICSAVANFGQRSFAYTPPTGFKALCTANLPASTIVKGNQYMDATLYTGNGSTQTITNSGGFSPDFVWLKTRSTISSNLLYDTLRGALNYLSSNQTAAETSLANSLTAFNSNGFSLGSDSNSNGNATTFVAWQWDAGSSTVTNTNGTISSQVRANPTAGVSVVTYTGNGSAGQSVGHGLGVAPKLWIIKNRSAGTGANWITYTTVIDGTLDYLFLDLTSAAANAGESLPTSSVFYIPNTVTGNTNGNNYVAYAFTDIAGFSKIGRYTGNGSTDNVFVYCGFKPRFIMTKRTDSTGGWYMYDTARNTYNVVGEELFANTSAAGSSATDLDILSNGFKWRAAISGTWIYMAFAENPFQNSNAF